MTIETEEWWIGNRESLIELGIPVRAVKSHRAWLDLLHRAIGPDRRPFHPDYMSKEEAIRALQFIRDAIAGREVGYRLIDRLRARIRQIKDVPSTMPICTACGSSQPFTIIYGLPSMNLMLQEQRGDVFLGGCEIFPESTKWRCKECGNEWGNVNDD